MHVDFERILIVDRDEGAMRLVDAVREFNQENGTSIRTIALHAESDRHAMFVREADEAFALDTADAAGAGVRSGTVSRLHPGLERVLRESGADAAWVGWGLGAPDVEVAELCERLGVVFVGAGSRLIRRVGDRIAARRFAAEAGFPVTAWSGGPVESYEEALAAARSEDEQMPSQRILPDHRPHGFGEPVEAAAHVGHLRRQPDSRALLPVQRAQTRKAGHRVSNAATTARKCSASKPGSTTT